MNAHESLIQGFDGFRETVASRDGAWVAPLREEGLRRFSELGFPHRRMEGWRHTSLDPIAKTAFVPAVSAPDAAALGVRDLGPAAIAGLDAHRLVFVNGRFAPELSDTAGLPGSVRVVNLAGALAAGEAAWAEMLGRLADLSTAPFAALNTAYMADGAVIVAPKGVKLDKPVHIVHLVRPGDVAAVYQPRNLFVLEDGSEATVIETYAAVAEGAYWTNAVTEIVVGAGAHLDHYKLQVEDPAAFHTSTTHVQQGADSTVANHSFSFGARIARNDINAYLGGENVDCRLMGLFVVDGDRHVDHHTQVDHAMPRGRSDENYRGILGGKATGVFRGRIHVHQDAQKTDAYQNNKNLLLTRDATIHTKPQLEIYADDVKCSHGATVGQLDDEAIFYLRSRGIDTREARRMLIRAFAGTIVDGVKVEALREHLDDALTTLLPTDALERESA